MIFTVSKEGIQRSHDFGPDSVMMTVRDLVQKMTKGFPEIPPPASNLLLSQIQEFLDNLLSQLPITPNQQRTFELREEVLGSAGAQDMDTNGYELSGLEDMEFLWENPQVGLDAVFRPEKDTLISPTAFNHLEEEEVHRKTPVC